MSDPIECLCGKDDEVKDNLDLHPWGWRCPEHAETYEDDTETAELRGYMRGKSREKRTKRARIATLESALAKAEGEVGKLKSAVRDAAEEAGFIFGVAEDDPIKAARVLGERCARNEKQNLTLRASLAEAQADLERVRGERDEALAKLKEAEGLLRDWITPDIGTTRRLDRVTRTHLAFLGGGGGTRSISQRQAILKAYR
jgi:hypothetical protein